MMTETNCAAIRCVGKCFCSLAWAALLMALTGGRCSGATFVVSNTNASGAGSLQQAILDANATSGLDTITFQIPGTGVRTISPTNALPSITDPVVMDGATQPGYAGTPIIEINGTNAGAASDGLRLPSGNSTIRGLIINRFFGAGIHLQAPGGSNHIEGNFVGTDATGALNRGNGQASTHSGGVFVDGSSGNWIGGPYATNRNLISGNGGSGVLILNCVSNTVQGNFIGTSWSGIAAISNSANGLTLYNAVGNLVGGSSASARNLISGNGASGVYLYSLGTAGNFIRGNYIGTDINGSVALGNASDGVTLLGTGGNTIGGTNSGEGNLISGNNMGGVALNGTGANGNSVLGNLIGTDFSGRVALGNKYAGVTIFGGNSNLVGGATAAARNLVSGNKLAGVYISTNSVGNLVQGNYIGVGIAGTNALGNGNNGISIDSASFNVIGSTAAGGRNLISGNPSYGVEIYNTGATANAVQGNYIGTDFLGVAAVSNNLGGVYILSSGNTIGGAAAGAGNLISGNGQDGVIFDGARALSNVVQGNFIGTSATGTARLGNGGSGIGISGASGNLIGGTTLSSGNLISGNTVRGIYMVGSGATGNIVQGNKIGTDATGYLPLGNIWEGIYMQGASSNTIGGAIAGAGNVIGANTSWGIHLASSSPWNVIQGNKIGTAIDGISPLSQNFHGIDCEAGSCNTRIGGDGLAANRIAYAAGIYAGVRIRDGSTNNAILGNAIFSNGSLGIDLGIYNVTPIIPCGTNGGANFLQNYPVISQVFSGNGTGIRGTLNSKTNRSYVIQFFANSACGPNGYGQGQVYLGQKGVSTTNSCTVGFVASFALEVPVGYVITSTATDSANNTSEFSACVPVSRVPGLNIAPSTNHIVNVAWTNTATGFVLKTTTNLAPPVLWTTATNAVVNTNGQFVVTLSTAIGNRFYVLRFE